MGSIDNNPNNLDPEKPSPEQIKTRQILSAVTLAGVVIANVIYPGHFIESTTCGLLAGFISGAGLCIWFNFGGNENVSN